MKPTPPTSVQLFWHVACMGTWRRVVAEQAALFREAGLSPIVCTLGPARPVRWIRRAHNVIYSSDDLHQYETPTLQRLWEWCQHHPRAAVIYVHTKGVSTQTQKHRAWRKLMEYWVVSQWRKNLPLLADHDAVGVNWRTSARLWPTPHFTGTFWMARADWITQLCSPWEHRSVGHPEWERENQHAIAVQQATWPRMHAEMWIGSKPGCRTVSLACRNRALPCMPRLLRLLKECGHPEYREASDA